MRSWKEHFDAWHKIQKTDLTPIKEEGQILAGREAEGVLREIVNENYSFKGCHSFAAKRLPDPRNNRKREVDLIVVTAKKIYVVECKNWSGTLFSRGAQWIQRTQNSGVFKDKIHDNTLDLNAYKMSLLGEYLYDFGIQIGEDDICQKVVFMNPKLKIQSAEIERHPDVVMPDRLGGYLDSQNNKLKTHERFLSSLIGVILDDETKGKVLDGLSIKRVGEENHDRLVELIRELPTWDKVFLRGTKILSGDVLARESNFYADVQNVPFNDIKEIRVSFSESKSLGFLKAALRIGKPVKLNLFDARGAHLKEKAANPHGTVTIQEAGSPSATRIDLYQIKTIRYGKYVDSQKRSFAYSHAGIIGKLLLAVISIGGLFTILAIFNNTFHFWSEHRPLLEFSESISSKALKIDSKILDSFAGEYNSKNYQITVSRKGEKLFLNSKYGTGELSPVSENEFTVINSTNNSSGRYKFVKNNRGKVTQLVYIDTDNNQQIFKKAK